MVNLFVLLLTFGLVWGFPKHLTSQTGRIIGGHAVNIKDYPYQLAFYVESGDYLYFCGAALIDPQWALTAAHCIHANYDRMHVRAGSSYKYSGGQDIDVVKVVKHPSYGEGEKFNYDFALLKLANKVTAKKSAPIPLAPSDYHIKEGAVADISGWGALENDGTTNVLLASKVPIVSYDYCREKYGSQFTDAMFCAGRLQEGGVDTCQGDSGGPVVIDNLLVGIVSWGYECGAAFLPGVYADVPHVTDWVNRQISEPGSWFAKDDSSDYDLDLDLDLDSDNNIDFDFDFNSEPLWR